MSNARRSRGELKIEDVLREAGLKYEIEYIFPDLTTTTNKPLRFDFAIFDDDGELDFLIEFQGEQHYTKVNHFGGQAALNKQRHNDAQKRSYCLRKDYPLLEIPYWDYDHINFDYILNKIEDLR